MPAAIVRFNSWRLQVQYVGDTGVQIATSHIGLIRRNLTLLSACYVALPALSEFQCVYVSEATWHTEISGLHSFSRTV